MAAFELTVVVTCYKEGALLQRAFKSLRNQTRQDFHILIINDASPCKVTNGICETLKAEKGTRLIRSERNGGLSASRNLGFQQAETDLCMFLDADDELPPSAVEDVLHAARIQPEADFYFGNYLLTESESQVTASVNCEYLSRSDGWISPEHLMGRWTLSGHCPCRKRVWYGVGGYAQRFSFGYQDVDFYMRALSAGFRGWYVNSHIYHWHRAATGMNASRERRALYFRGYSWKYYQGLGKQSGCWEYVVTQFLMKRDDAMMRTDARRLVFRLFPDRLSRGSLYLKYLIRVCGPRWLDDCIRRWLQKKAVPPHV